MIVVVSGLIGVGKTSLCEELVYHFSAKGFFEPVESNPFLNPYLEDRAKYSFGMQINLLFERTQAFAEAVRESVKGSLCICDRSMYEDWAFADVQLRLGYMDNLHYSAYKKWHQHFVDSLPLPDLILYLDASLDTVKRRQIARNRDGEECYDELYNSTLYDAYKDLMPRLACKCPVVKIDAENSKSSVLYDAVDAINKRYSEILNFEPIYHGGF